MDETKTKDKDTITGDIEESMLIGKDNKGVEITNKDKKQIIESLNKELREYINKDRVTMITVFGIFASIVTFLSIEIQILKNICDFYRLLGFSFYLLGGLLGFIFVLQFIGKSWIENDKTTEWKDFFRNPSIIITLIVLLLLLLTGFINMGLSKESESQCRNDKYQEQLQIINGSIEDLSGEFQETKNNQQYLQEKIRKLESNFNSIHSK